MSVDHIKQYQLTIDFVSNKAQLVLKKLFLQFYILDIDE
jgi:hypothetical protein